MDSALTFVRGLQGIFWIWALLFGLGAGVGLVSLTREPEGITPLFFLIELAFAALFTFGAVLLRRAPLSWSLGAAIPLSLAFASTLAGQGGGGPLILLLGITMVISWVGAYFGFRVRSLRRQNPKLAERDAEKTLPLSKALMIGTATLAFFLLIGAATTWNLSETPPVEAAKLQTPKASLEPSLKRFEEAWKAKDLKALGALYPERLANRGRRLGRRMKQHGFDGFPKLTAGPEIEEKGPFRRSVYYETEEGGIELVYKYTQDQWELVALRM